MKKSTLLLIICPLITLASNLVAQTPSPTPLINVFTNSDVSVNSQLGQSMLCVHNFAGVTGPNLVSSAPGNSQGIVHIYQGGSGSMYPEIAKSLGDNSGDKHGINLSLLKDLDADGHPELIIGQDKSGSKSIQLHCSADPPSTGFTNRDLEIFPLAAGGTFSEFGTVVKGLQDRPIIAVGAPGHTGGSCAYSYCGAVELWQVTGSNCSSLGAVFITVFEGDGNNISERFGQSITRIGNIAGGPFEDFVVGSPGALNNDGLIKIIADGAGTSHSVVATIYGPASVGERFGSSVSNLGDMNGDGYDDLLIGAPSASSSTGKAYLLSGANLTALDGLDASSFPSGILCSLIGPGTLGEFGTVVRGVGDISGDGKPDFAISSPYYQSSRGIVEVFTYVDFTSSCHLISQNIGSTAGELFGISISGAEPFTSLSCDLNADSFSDLLVGNRNDTPTVDSGGWDVFAGYAASTPSPTPTPTATPTSTPTPTPSPTPTATPTPNGPTDLRYRLNTTGRLRGQISIDAFNPSECTFNLYGRISTRDLSKRRQVFQILNGITLDPASDTLTFIAQNLPKIYYLDPHTLHLIATFDCNGVSDPITSNVASRSLLGCGVEEATPLDPGPWESNLRKKIRVEDPAITAKKKKRRLKRKRRRKRLRRLGLL